MGFIFQRVFLGLILQSLIVAVELFKPFNVSYDGRTMIIDGKRRILISGGIHYPRATPQMWPDLISKSKEGGVDFIETYVFWNGHEPIRGQIGNEYGNIENSHGLKGKDYIRWAAKMAVGLRAGVPWVMCKQADAPEYIDAVQVAGATQTHITNSFNSFKTQGENLFQQLVESFEAKIFGLTSVCWCDFRKSGRDEDIIRKR